MLKVGGPLRNLVHPSVGSSAATPWSHFRALCPAPATHTFDPGEVAPALRLVVLIPVVPIRKAPSPFLPHVSSATAPSHLNTPLLSSVHPPSSPSSCRTRPVDIDVALELFFVVCR